MDNQSATDKNREDLPQIHTIFVIDDDDNWCYLAKITLQDAGIGKQIITAKNGLEGLKKLQTMAASGERLPELIFLDIKMPVMDGFELLEQLTRSQELDLSHTKIFMCTSSFLAKDKERAKLYPVAGFINKPLTAEIVEDILR